MPTVDVVRTHLELRSRDAFRPANAPHEDVRVERELPCTNETYRDLYARVGQQWHWRDRLTWSDDGLAAYLERPDVYIWILRDRGVAAGYFEFIAAHDEVEIVYFGLLPHAMGRGLGKYMLTRAVEEAWALGVSRVCLNTCTLDGPNALPNYRARGFEPYMTETYAAEI